MGRPGLPPGRYFRLLLLGYFEGLDSERGIAWRAADSLAVRGFVGLGLDAAAPDHSTISRTRRLIDVETHRSEEHTSELQSLAYLVCRLLLEKKKKIQQICQNHCRRETNDK